MKNNSILWNRLTEHCYRTELIYWMGFLMADGCVYRTQYKLNYTSTVSLRLSVQDEDIVRRFALFWTGDPNAHLIRNAARKSTSGITKENVAFKFSITEHEQHFVKFGLIPNKTYNFVEPCTMNNDELRNYLRGWFDGDGCVYTKLKQKEYVHVTGMPDGVNWFLLKLLSLGYNGTYSNKYKPMKASNAIRLRIDGNNNLRKFYSILQPRDNEPFMERKWTKLRNHLENLVDRRFKQSTKK